MTFGLLHHVEINVSDLEVSRSFWSWLLEYMGWHIYQEWEAGFSFKKDHYYLVFVQTREKYLSSGYNRCNVGLNHLAFHAPTKDDVTFLAKKIQEKNINILYPEKHPHAGGPHHYAVYFEDPDRLKVELTTA